MSSETAGNHRGNARYKHSFFWQEQDTWRRNPRPSYTDRLCSPRHREWITATIHLCLIGFHSLFTCLLVWLGRLIVRRGHDAHTTRLATLEDNQAWLNEMSVKQGGKKQRPDQAWTSQKEKERRNEVIHEEIIIGILIMSVCALNVHILIEPLFLHGI